MIESCKENLSIFITHKLTKNHYFWGKIVDKSGVDK